MTTEIRTTEVGLYVEYHVIEIRITEAGMYIEFSIGRQVKATSVGLYVEYTMPYPVTIYPDEYNAGPMVQVI